MKRLKQGLGRRRKELTRRTVSLRKKQHHLHEKIIEFQERMAEFKPQLSQRIQKRDAIDTETLCRQRHLEKDQIIVDWQILLNNLKRWK